MSDIKLLERSCHIALTTFLYSLGKFAERAGADIDTLEQYLPDLASNGISSIKYHKPETFLQWIITTADRVASGFGREAFTECSASESSSNQCTIRQLTLMEQITLDQAKQKQPEKSHNHLKYCYELKPLSPNALFPHECEKLKKTSPTEAQKQYHALWNDFAKALKKIPTPHKADLALWLDHFETLWGTYAYAMPASVTGQIIPDVSLYDHSRVAAALAVTLWRYHSDGQQSEEEARKQLYVQWDENNQDQALTNKAWEDEKFLLIQGDFFGIQNFIFSSGSETQKRAAKLLRGRSFYISLLTECAALKVLDALDLPPTSQITNAAGKFLIVAPNTAATVKRLKQVQNELDQWFLAQTYGQSGVGLAWLSASCNDFCQSKGDAQPFRDLLKRLFEKLELSKFQRMQLTDSTTQAPVVFESFLDAFDNDKGVCAIDGKSPGTEKSGDIEGYISELAHDQMTIGDALAKGQQFERLLIERLLIARKTATLHHDKKRLWLLKLPIFDYQVAITANDQASGVFSQLARENNLLRAIDFSLPKLADAPLWNGYARRNINAYVPIVDEQAEQEEKQGKYDKVSEANKEQFKLDDIKPLDYIACDDREPMDKHENRWQGQTALMTLKGDVDDLGAIFQKGLHAPTFAKMAALSRQMNAFFAIYLPSLCHSGNNNSDPGFKNIYTVFAGGDDFFLIGPWHSTIKLASKMQQDFQRYVTFNKEIHFSVGLSMTKPKLPIRYLADASEAALEDAKAYIPNQIPKPEKPAKNAVSCFSQVMSWADFQDLVARGKRLGEHKEEQSLSTGYLYGLLNLVEMREELDNGKPEKALWRSYFSYRTYRMLERQRSLNDQRRKSLHAQLAKEIAEDGIEKHKGNYRVALFTHLYQQRD